MDRGSQKVMNDTSLYRVMVKRSRLGLGLAPLLIEQKISQKNVDIGLLQNGELGAFDAGYD